MGIKHTTGVLVGFFFKKNLKHTDLFIIFCMFFNNFFYINNIKNNISNNICVSYIAQCEF